MLGFFVCYYNVLKYITLCVLCVHKLLLATEIVKIYEADISFHLAASVKTASAKILFSALCNLNIYKRIYTSKLKNNSF